MLSKARTLLLEGDIEADENRLEVQLRASLKDNTNIEQLLNKAVSNIPQLDILYEGGTVNQKRKIIGSIFPEKLIFDGF